MKKKPLPHLKQAPERRKVTLTDDQLARLNHLRVRADVPVLTKEDAERLLSRLSEFTYQAAMDAIR